MKIAVWIRHDAEGNATMRVDAKYEDRDMPRIQNFGRRLMKAKLAAAECCIEDIEKKCDCKGLTFCEIMDIIRAYLEECGGK